MTYTLFRAFHAVAEQGSFTRAAESLRLTQPTLSGQVKALEEAYGIKLFERRGRGVELTSLGRELQSVTRKFFGLEEEAEQLLLAARGLSRGHLRLAADAPAHIGLLAAFNRHYPGITVSFNLGNSERVREWVLDHRADIGIIPDAAGDRRLYGVPYRQERLVAFVPRDHPWAARRLVRFEELADYRLVLRERGSQTRSLLESALAKHGISLRDMMEIGSREAVREAIASGLGVSVVVESEFQGDDRLCAVEFENYELATTEYVVCLPDRSDLPMIRAFFEVMRTGTGAETAAAV